MPKLVSVLLAAATACGALRYIAVEPYPALAKMDTIEEEQYHETIEAARTLVKSKDWAKAQAKYEEARQQALKSDDKKKQVLIIEKLGSIAYDQADYQNAADRFKEAVTMADADNEISASLRAECLFDLSNTLIKLKKDSEARPYLSRCLEISRKIYSPNHPNLAMRSSAYAKLLSALGEKEESEKLTSASERVINNFMEESSSKIKRLWQPPAENFSYRLTVKYDVVNHGKVDNVEVTKSSGSAIADKAGIAAVKAAAPFTDIVSSDPDDKVELAFSFDYNYDAARNHLAGPSGSAATSSASASATGSQSGSSSSHALSSTKKERRQTREEQSETEAKIKEESSRSSSLKEQIEKLPKTSAEDAAALAPLYVLYSNSLIVQGKWQEASQQLLDAMQKPCFKGKSAPALALSIALAHTYLRERTLGNPEPILQSALADENFKTLSTRLQKQALQDYGHCLSGDQKFAQAQDYYTRAQELPE